MFVPHSNIDLNTIFDELKISSLEELFSHIPKELLIDGGLDFDESLSELEATELFETIASKNASKLVCFAGGGHYDIYLPQVHICIIYDILASTLTCALSYTYQLNAGENY